MGDILSIRLTQALRRELRRVSKRQNRAASEIAREALRRYLAVQKLHRLRDTLRPHAQKRWYLTDDDVFKAVS